MEVMTVGEDHGHRYKWLWWDWPIGGVGWGNPHLEFVPSHIDGVKILAWYDKEWGYANGLGDGMSREGKLWTKPLKITP